MKDSELRIAIVAPHASARFGGESILPLHYFRHLRKRGIAVWMVLHERTRNELAEVLGSDIDRVRFVSDTSSDKRLYRLSSMLPARIGDNSFGFLLRLSTQLRQKQLLKRLIEEESINLVHEPSPVSPKNPSIMHGLGVPVVIGPMNGGMDFPPPFKFMQPPLERLFVSTARSIAPIMNRLVPGKRKADVLLVANARTAAALPMQERSNVVELVENGVDFSVFSREVQPRDLEGANGAEVAIFFVGRLVKWKAVDVLLKALTRIQDANFRLHILGDGPEREHLQQLARELGLAGRVEFHGFLPQKKCAELLVGCDLMVLPSLYECGGAVVLEAMAMELAVVATNWGGPADYLNEDCGKLVDVGANAEEFQHNMATALRTLIEDGDLRRKMGAAGLQRARKKFAWEAKIDQISAIYKETIINSQSSQADLTEMAAEKL